MKIMDPHLLHLIAYFILTVLAMRIGARMFLTLRFTGLVVQSGVLRRSKVRLIELLSLEAIRVSPLEAIVIVVAHLMLVIGSIVAFFAK